MPAFVPANPLVARTSFSYPFSVQKSPVTCPFPLRANVRQTLRASIAVRGSSTNPYRIAVLSGDGAGPGVAAAVKKVLGALAADADLHFEFIDAPYGADAFAQEGVLVPDSTLDVCRSADAVLRSYQGTARGAVDKQGSAHLQLRDKLGLFAQFRPVIVYPSLAGLSTLKNEVISAVDMMLVREISAGALASASSEEQLRSEISYTEKQVSDIASAALKVAQQRSGRILNVDKADVMPVSRFWRRVVHDTVAREAAGDEGIALSDMYVDDFVREVIHRPAEFDVVVTSNLFGDICAEVIDALAGPQRLSPSFWKNREGLGVYGPADIYNLEAYPNGAVNSVTAAAGSGTGSMSAIALTRAASMMLRYELDEPTAANTIQRALRKTMDDMVEEEARRNEFASSNGSGNGNGGTLSGVSAVEAGAEEYADVMVRSMQLLRQFEEVCDPTECGE